MNFNDSANNIDLIFVFGTSVDKLLSMEIVYSKKLRIEKEG